MGSLLAKSWRRVRSTEAERVGNNEFLDGGAFITGIKKLIVCLDDDDSAVAVVVARERCPRQADADASSSSVIAEELLLYATASSR